MFKIQNTQNATLLDNVNYDIIPEYTRHQALQIGDLKMSLNTSINGWLVCDGSAVQRSEYRDLFNVIGTNFGNSTDSNFFLPDFTSRVIGAFGQSARSSGLTRRDMGDSIGTETETISINELPPHNHTGTTDAGGVHSHTHNANGGAGTSASPAVGLAISNSFSTAINTDTSNGELNVMTTPIALSIGNSSSHTHTFTSNNTGGGQPQNNIQPTLFGCNVLIFAKFLPRTEMTPIVYLSEQPIHY